MERAASGRDDVHAGAGYMFGGQRRMFYRGEILSGVETLWAIVVIVPNERRASPELASGWSSERGYLTRSAAHDHAMTVIIRALLLFVILALEFMPDEVTPSVLMTRVLLKRLTKGRLL